MYLNKESIAHLERVIGKPLKDVTQMDLKEEIRYVESKTKKPLIYSTHTDHRIKGRGSPLIAKRRLFTMADVDKKLGELK